MVKARSMFLLPFVGRGMNYVDPKKIDTMIFCPFLIEIVVEFPN